MPFTSLVFLIFLPCFLAAYYATRGRGRLAVCLLGSYVFYGWWDWRFLSLIIIPSLVDYYIGRRLGTGGGSRRRFWVTVSLVLNLGTLAAFKYFNFFAHSLAAALSQLGLEGEPWHLRLALPLGISFYTFQRIGYVLDVYWKRIEPERSLLHFATFAAFFPQLLAGPISRAGNLLPQFHQDQPFVWERFVEGGLRIIWGYVLKLVIADSLAPVVSVCFAAPEASGSLMLVIGAVFYAFQVYGDFAGYSSIAIGVAQLLGIDLGANFDRPYFSASFSEFWSRWHISLSSWLRDYLYIPLGGNRHGKWNTYRNLMATMLLGGLWHGAGWTFVVWGGLHGLFLVGQRLLGGLYRWLVGLMRIPDGVSRFFLVTFVFGLTCLAWIFFRAETLASAIAYLQQIATLEGFAFAAVGNKFLVVKGLTLILLLTTLEAASFRVEPIKVLVQRPVLAMASACTLLWLLAAAGTFGSNAFIYFQF